MICVFALENSGSLLNKTFQTTIININFLFVLLKRGCFRFYQYMFSQVFIKRATEAEIS